MGGSYDSKGSMIKCRLLRTLKSSVKVMHNNRETYGTILDLSRLWRALRSIEELVGLDSKTKGKQ